MSRVIVVGAGLFGSIIAKALELDGHIVTVLDDNRPMSGSKPSACLMKPSWFSSMGKDKHEPSLALLDKMYGLEEFDFKVRPSGIATSSYRIDPSKALLINRPGSYMEGLVTYVGPDHVKVSELKTETGVRNVTMRADHIIVAAGVWCGKILAEAAQWDIRPTAGIVFRTKGAQCSENRIDVWAPYKQLVGFQEYDDQVWIGDGSAILEKNWKDKRIAQSVARCEKFAHSLGVAGTTESIQGLRPYVKGAKPCLFEQVSPKVWLATGGAKNGTIAAGWVASELRKALS